MKNGIIHRLLDRLLKKREIVNCDRDIYLHRWYLLRTKKIGIFIHKFVRSDEDRALHDHPWPFLVIPIWRGYIEHSEVPPSIGFSLGISRRVYPILGTRYRPATYRHRVELFEGCTKVYNSIAQLESEAEYQLESLPAWSIFIRFKKFREWGFWPKEGFVKWNDWWSGKCGGDDS